MAAYFGPGSTGSQAPQGYASMQQRASSFLDPRLTTPQTAGRQLGQNTVSLQGIGDFAVSNDPNDPLRQFLGGRLPNEGPQAGMANAWLSQIMGQGGQGGQGGAALPPLFPWAQGGTGGGSGLGAPLGGGGSYAGGGMQGGYGGPGGQFGGGGTGANLGGATSPGQLASLLPSNPTAQDIQGMNAAGLAFNEYERIPQVYGGPMGQQVGNQIQAQLGGQDAPFTPSVVNLLQGQAGDQASAGHRARQKQIGAQAAGRGLGGGGMEMGLKLASQEQASKQRAESQRQLGITSQLENFGARERGRSAGMDFLGQQAGAMGQAALAKGNALSNFQNFGQGEYAGLGNALAGAGGGAGLGVGGNVWSSGGNAVGQSQQQQDPMAQLMAALGAAGMGGQQQQQQAPSGPTNGMGYASGRNAGGYAAANANAAQSGVDLRDMFTMGTGGLAQQQNAAAAAQRRQDLWGPMAGMAPGMPGMNWGQVPTGFNDQKPASQLTAIQRWLNTQQGTPYNAFG